MSNHDRSNHDRRIMSENPGVYIAMKSAVNGYGYSRAICHVYIRDLGGSRSKNLLDNSDLAFRSCISMR